MNTYPSKMSLALTAIAGALLTSFATASIEWTGGGFGDWRDGLNWSDDPTYGDVYVSFDNDPLDGLPGPHLDFVIPSGFNTIGMAGSNLNGGLNIPTITVLGNSTATFQDNKQAINMTINMEDTSQWWISFSLKLGAGLTLNYNSSATSGGLVPTDRLYMWRAGAVLNLNNGLVQVGLLHFEELGPVINLNGGDLLFTTLSAGVGAKINFTGNAGSTLSMKPASSVDDLNYAIDLGYLTIDGLSAAESPHSFVKTLNNDTLEITVLYNQSAVWWGFPIVDGYADTGDWFGWAYVTSSPWIYSLSLNNWMYAPEQDPAGGAWFYIPRAAALPDQAATWWGYPVVDGYADTGDWFGWAYVVDSPWIYSVNLGGWMYAPEQDPAGGAWFFILR